MRRTGPKPIALDHNFPETLLRPVAPFLPEVELHWIRHLDPALAELQDHQLIFELHRRAFPIMLTGDYKMTSDPRVLVALEQTRMSLLTARGIGDDPILATGVVLRDLLPLVRNNHPQGLVYVARPSRVTPKRARELLADSLVDDQDVDDVIRAHGLPLKQRTYYPDDDPRRIR